jgi:glucokinase
MTKNGVIGVDMGGTKINAGLIRDNGLVKSVTLPTLAHESEYVIVNQLIKAINMVIVPNCEGIGVGVPSVVDSQKGVVYNVVAIPAWKEVHLKKVLENHFQVPVFVNNDSNCFALGENYFGVGRGISDFVAVTLGTGLGCGIIIHDKLYEGVNTGAGEVGCVPYKEGILEHYCASLFFKSRGYDGKGLSELARLGNKQALQLFDEFGSHLAHAIKIVLYTVDPQLIILGGSISNSFDLFMPSVWRHLNSFLFPTVIKNLRIEKSDLKDSALLGAAGLIYNKLG